VTMADWSERMAMFRVPRPQRVLVLAPHPDDEAIGCGGYLAWLAERGSQITAVFVTDGGLGPDGKHDEALARRRQDESTVAAKVLGIREVVRWHLPDGQLGSDGLPAGRLAGLVVERQIEAVLVPHVAESHPDHAAVARLPGRLELNMGSEVLVMTYEIWTPQVPDCVVNISDRMEDKLWAIRAYESQSRRFDLERLTVGLGQYRAAWSRIRGWQFAEGYRRFTLAEYREWCHAH